MTGVTGVAGVTGVPGVPGGGMGSEAPGGGGAGDGVGGGGGGGGGGEAGSQGRQGWIRVPRTARYRVLGDPERAAEVWFVLHGYGQLAERFVARFQALPGLAEGTRAVVAPEALSRFYLDVGGGEHGADSPVGATWMTREDREHEIRDYVEYLDRLADELLGGTGVPPAEAPGEASGKARGETSAEAPGEAREEASGEAREEASGEARGERPPRVRVLGFSQGAATASRWVVYGRLRPAELILWAGGLAHDLDGRAAFEALRHVAVRFVTGSEDGWAAERARRDLAWLAERNLAGKEVSYQGGHRVLPGVLEAHWPV